MKITYDSQKDVLHILFKETTLSGNSQQQADTTFNYDQQGNLIKLEIMNASQHITNPQKVEYSVTNNRLELDSNSQLQTNPSLEQRRAFLKLPLEERRRILAQQSESMVDHYQQNLEWQEFLAGDIIEY